MNTGMDAEEKKNPEKPKEKKEIGFFAIVLVLAGVLIVLGYSLANVSSQKTITQKCLEYQNDPELQFPCSCVPTLRPLNESDIVELKTDSLCTCFCDIGDNRTAAIEVRVAR